MSSQTTSSESASRFVDRATEDGQLEEDERARAGPLIAGIPAYNEEARLGTVVLLVQKYVDEVVVVDDGSTDATAEVAREAGATVIRHEENSGKGSAIRTFIDYAQDQEFAACVLVDGDGQHSPADIPQVVEPVVSADADMVIGSRYVDGGGADDIPRYRRFGQQVLDVMTTFPSQTPLTDTQSGFRALSPEAIQVMSTSTEGFGIESEMIDVASRERLAVTEEPITVAYDDADSTLNPFRHGLQVAWTNLRLLRDRTHHSLLYVGLAGAVLTIVGILATLDVVAALAGATFSDRIQLAVALLLLVGGLLSTFSGIVVTAIGGDRGSNDRR